MSMRKFVGHQGGENVAGDVTADPARNALWDMAMRLGMHPSVGARSAELSDQIFDHVTWLEERAREAERDRCVQDCRSVWEEHEKALTGLIGVKAPQEDRDMERYAISAASACARRIRARGTK